MIGVNYPIDIPARFHRPLIKAFKVLAFIEALTWIALLIAMVVKRVADNDGAIRIPGMAHGGVFVLFVLVTIATGIALKWSPKVLMLGLASSIPPLFTIWFEIWASRNGHLDAPADDLDPDSRAKLNA